MEEILANLDKAKYPVPDPYPYQEARRLFRGASFDDFAVLNNCST